MQYCDHVGRLFWRTNFNNFNHLTRLDRKWACVFSSFRGVTVAPERPVVEKHCNKTTWGRLLKHFTLHYIILH